MLSQAPYPGVQALRLRALASVCRRDRGQTAVTDTPPACDRPQTRPLPQRPAGAEPCCGHTGAGGSHGLMPRRARETGHLVHGFASMTTEASTVWDKLNQSVDSVHPFLVTLFSLDARRCR